MCLTTRCLKLLLSKFRSDSGSAVTDFVLLVVPASLLTLPLIELFGIYQGAIVKEQVSYEISRFAALADVTFDQSIDYQEDLDPQARLTKSSKQSECSILVSNELKKSITFWAEAIEIPIEGSATCEK